MKRLEELTLEEKLGQMLLFGWQADGAGGASPSEGYPGTAPESAATAINAHALRLLKEWKVGGVILMGRNVESPQQVAALANGVQAPGRNAGSAVEWKPPCAVCALPGPALPRRDNRATGECE